MSILCKGRRAVWEGGVWVGVLWCGCATQDCETARVLARALDALQLCDPERGWVILCLCAEVLTLDGGIQSAYSPVRGINRKSWITIRCG